MRKKWQVRRVFDGEDIVDLLLNDRGIKEKEKFLHPPKARDLNAADVGIDPERLTSAVTRIRKAIQDKESVVVYADYDADGITAGAAMWETLWKLGARVMPYIPHRTEEGYGLSEKGIDTVRQQYDPSLIITVDHGITAIEKVAYAKKLGIDVIVTDHHVAPKKLPDCLIVHTTQVSGSGVSWFVAKQLSDAAPVELAAIGTIADLVPLTGANRSVAFHGLAALRKTKRMGLTALFADAGIPKESIETYTISHMLAPRLNAMGRLEHALDALRLLCTTDPMRAKLLAQKLGLTNKERQKLTEDTVSGARLKIPKQLKKLIFISDPGYNQGIIGLVAGKLTEEFYRPSVVVSVGDGFSKASARSIPGFNIIEAIRKCSDLLVDAGGHPMAAGFTVETKNLSKLKKKLEDIAEDGISDDALIRRLPIDIEMPLDTVTEKFWKELQMLAPFGIGNFEPVFASRNVEVLESRLIGATKKHLKLRLAPGYEAVAFNMADYYFKLKAGTHIDIAYSIDMNEWNGKRSLQLKIKDLQFPS